MQLWVLCNLHTFQGINVRLRGFKLLFNFTCLKFMYKHTIYLHMLWLIDALRHAICQFFVINSVWFCSCTILNISHFLKATVGSQQPNQTSRVIQTNVSDLFMLGICHLLYMPVLWCFQWQLRLCRWDLVTVSSLVSVFSPADVLYIGMAISLG